MEGLPTKSLRYNQGKLDWTLLHYQSLKPMVDVLEYGAFKYSIFENQTGERVLGKDVLDRKDEILATHKVIYSGKDNWKLDFDPKEVLKSLMRHIHAMSDGEELDLESGLPHIGHAMCNLMFMEYHINRLKSQSNGNE